MNLSKKGPRTPNPDNLKLDKTRHIPNQTNMAKAIETSYKMNKRINKMNVPLVLASLFILSGCYQENSKDLAAPAPKAPPARTETKPVTSTILKERARIEQAIIYQAIIEHSYGVSETCDELEQKAGGSETCEELEKACWDEHTRLVREIKVNCEGKAGGSETCDELWRRYNLSLICVF